MHLSPNGPVDSDTDAFLVPLLLVPLPALR
jgi:hypothetical protein